ncbi:tetratricopeptide repeat protein [Pantanalinema rosaneae CENA516]|uniref:tetratricopeptide repeat protein n=1 Tax=Pantanalinema rosaneae TaxID=1620701 RepID=UPI003D6EB130
MDFKASALFGLFGLGLTLTPALIATDLHVVQAQPCPWWQCFFWYNGTQYGSGHIPGPEVIAQLENLVRLGKATTDNQLLLAYTYNTQGKYDLAKKTYSTALKSAKKARDTGRQAIALQGLGQVSVATSRRQEAISQLTAAKALYTNLRYQKGVDEVNRILTSLSKPKH